MKPSDYTFETFVATPSNRLAQLAAKKICETPNSFNPLYIYGPPGVGKTHLLQAVANEYTSKGLSAICLSSNQFLEGMIEAIKTGTNMEFGEKYHQTDVLLIDRLQYISGKEASQEELFNIVEKRLSDHKQTVFAGNAHPTQILNLDSELSACLAGGLCIEIPTPDFEGKTQIISKKLKAYEIDWPTINAAVQSGGLAVRRKQSRSIG